MSKFFFVEHFFNFLLTLKNDKIMAVRRKFCNAAALIIIKFFSIPRKMPALDDKERQQRYQLIDALD